MRLLVVDDDEMAARALEWALTGLGVDVRILTSGRNVISVVAETAPDGVVLDVILHDVDGVTLCRQLRERWRELPVVLTSGRDADFPGVQDALADRKTAFLQKPFEMSLLLRTFKLLLRK